MFNFILKKIIKKLIFDGAKNNLNKYSIVSFNQHEHVLFLLKLVEWIII